MQPEHITQSRGGSRREHHVFLFALFSTFALAFIRGVGSVKGLGWERESMAGTSLSIPHSPFPICPTAQKRCVRIAEMDLSTPILLNMIWLLSPSGCNSAKRIPTR
ncbi:predicted protein [Histoplasma capsulatum H143]|uniref:Uncharacterized protein n=1 Tax=Ajellomyces capsulatus (strain H143) TaxID=544712 RepID=C6HBS8_AJECH|nr:predicted protein [Histoplasma capsulatum H143]